MKNYFERFVEWQNYIHYILNGLFLVGEVLVGKLYGLSTLKMILVLIFLIFINDSIIHAMFWYAPKRIRWRD